MNRIYTICCLLLFIIADGMASETPQNVLAQSNLKYFSLLKNALRDTSIDNQIKILNNHLSEQPDCAELYLKIYERFLINNQADKAMQFFSKLTTMPQRSFYSYWMLAKLARLRGADDEAIEHLRHALKQTNQLSVRFIRDYLKCHYLHGNRIDVSAHQLKRQTARNVWPSIEIVAGQLKMEYDAVIRISHRLTPPISENPELLHIIGQCYYRLNEYDKADSVWRHGYRVASTLHNLHYQTKFLINFSKNAKDHRKYERARMLLDSAMTIAKMTDDYLQFQRIEGNRGSIEYKIENYKEAIVHCKNAISYADILHLYAPLATWHSFIALSLFQLGDFCAALQHYELSEKFVIKEKDRRKLVNLKILKADLYFYLNQQELARKLYLEANAIAEQCHLESYCYRAKVKLANFYMSSNDFEAARTQYQAYISYLNKRVNKYDLDYWIYKLALTYKAEEKYELARYYLLKAVAEAERANLQSYMEWYRLEIAEIDLTRGKFDAAYENYDVVRQISITRKDTNMLSQVQMGLGDYYQKTGDLNLALDNYRRAIRLIEKTRQKLQVQDLRVGYFSKRMQAYREMVHCFARRFYISNYTGDLDSLFFYEQRTRGRELFELQSSNGNRYNGNSEFYEDYMNECAKFRILQSKIRKVKEHGGTAADIEPYLRRHDLAKNSLMSKKLRLFEQKREIVRNDQWLQKFKDEIRQKDCALLMYHIADRVSFVLTVFKGAVELIRLDISTTECRSNVDSLLTPFHQFKTSDVRSVPFKASIAHRLYQKLIAPVARRIKLPKNLVIIPDVALNGMPFEMLLREPPAKSAYTPNDYPDYANAFLMQFCNIVYCANILSSIQLSERRRAPDVLVFANPTARYHFNAGTRTLYRNGAQWNFEPLPFSEIEAARIKEIYPRAIIRKRNDATKKRLLADIAKQDIIHIATHGFIDESFDDFSGLVLSAENDSTDDGLLMGYEISRLRLNCDLVTLSACETGVGKVVVGEGVLGLPRLFLGAGAKTVLMTLWKVEDHFTSELMPRFYDLYLNDRFTKSESLCLSKREILNRKSFNGQIYHQHPFFWAAFVLFGDPGVRTIDRFSDRWIVILVLAIFIIGYIGIKKYHYRQNVCKNVSGCL